MPAPGPFPRRRRAPLPGWMWGLIALCCAIEAGMFAAGWLAPDLQRRVYLIAGFWSQLVRGTAQPEFAAQPVTMFVTYGLIHSGPLHLAMNMISLVPIARELGRAVGGGWMAAIYLVTQIAAGLAFAWLSPSSLPMVGASGAVFGLAGALVAHAAVTKRRRGTTTGPLMRAVVVVLGINVGLTLLVPEIAWQAHLGGGVIGVAMGLALALCRRPAVPLAVQADEAALRR